MKKLALAAISLLIAGSASAADMRPAPYKAPAPAPVAVGYNWTGCYVGVGGGYGMSSTEGRTFTGGVPFSAEEGSSGRGWFGTVQVGCDYQVGSNIVIGAFADYDFGDIKGNYRVPGLDAQGDEKLRSSWSAGGRIGYLPFQQQQLLVFVSGGYTQARFNEIALRDEHGAQPLIGATVPKHTYSGWFIGSGYEYQFGWLPIQGLTWKTEYRFADYSADTLALTGNLAGFSVDNHKYVQTIRSELVWRFNFGGPVVARY